MKPNNFRSQAVLAGMNSLLRSDATDNYLTSLTTEKERYEVDRILFIGYPIFHLELSRSLSPLPSWFHPIGWVRFPYRF